jgi:hypothetical protein
MARRQVNREGNRAVAAERPGGNGRGCLNKKAWHMSALQQRMNIVLSGRTCLNGRQGTILEGQATWSNLMSCSKFSVGDRVELDYAPHARGEVGGYRILRLTPYRGSEPLYRIKTIFEPFERIVRESELTLVTESQGVDASCEGEIQLAASA